MLCGYETEFFDQFGFIFSQPCRNRERKTTNGNGLGNIRKEFETGLEYPALVSFRNINELQQSGYISPNRDVGIFTLKLLSELAPIRRYQMGVPLYAITYRPGRPLRKPINRSHHELHEFSKLRVIITDIFADLRGLSLGMNFEKGLADVHLH
jgi:hypothetical protein